MKTDSLTKAYAGLSLKERAALAFHYCAAADELEMTRILSTVPMVTCRGPDLEYRRWMEGFTRLAGWWGIEHWHAKARAMAAMGGHQIAADSNKMDQAEKLLSAVKRWESVLLALDRALNDIAAEHGFEADAVRRISEAEAYEPLFIGHADPEQLNAKREALRRILTLQS